MDFKEILKSEAKLVVRHWISGFANNIQKFFNSSRIIQYSIS